MNIASSGVKLFNFLSGVATKSAKGLANGSRIASNSARTFAAHGSTLAAEGAAAGTRSGSVLGALRGGGFNAQQAASAGQKVIETGKKAGSKVLGSKVGRKALKGAGVVTALDVGARTTLGGENVAVATGEAVRDVATAPLGFLGGFFGGGGDNGAANVAAQDGAGGTDFMGMLGGLAKQAMSAIGNLAQGNPMALMLIAGGAAKLMGSAFGMPIISGIGTLAMAAGFAGVAMPMVQKMMGGMSTSQETGAEQPGTEEVQEAVDSVELDSSGGGDFAVQMG